MFKLMEAVSLFYTCSSELKGSITSKYISGNNIIYFNGHFLKDLEYINLIKETINKVSNEYKKDESVNAILLWDVLKMQIRASSIKHAKQKRTEKTLKTEILMLECKPELRSVKFLQNWRLRNKA